MERFYIRTEIYRLTDVKLTLLIKRFLAETHI